MSFDMKKSLIDYYETTSTFYGSYQSHKEITAWAGLVLHILFCGLMTRIEMPKEFISVGSVWLIGFIIVIAFLVWRYIKNQLEMKRNASALGAAAKFFVSEIMQKNENGQDFSEYITIEESPDKRSQAQHVLPTKLRTKAKVIEGMGAGEQTTTEYLIYSLLVFSTFSVIFAIIARSPWVSSI